MRRGRIPLFAAAFLSALFSAFRAAALPILLIVFLSASLSLYPATGPSAAETGDNSQSIRGLAPDQADEDEPLNQELWEFAKNTPYSKALEHIEKARQENRSVASTEIVLPTGWKIDPAGKQAKLGRFPHEAVWYSGRVVVLNTGYYVKEPQEISIVNPDSGETDRTLRLESMFPSALAAQDGDLYISGGISSKVHRFDKNFNQVREYAAGGYTAGLAPVDSSRIAVACMVTAGSEEDYQKGKYGEGKIVILNTRTGAIEHEAPAGYFPHTVRRMKGKLYVTALGDNKVRVFDLKLRPVKTIEVGRTPQDICSDRNSLYVVNTGSDSVSVIDPAKDAVKAVLDMKSQGTSFGNAPTSCTAEGGSIYVTQATANSVAVYDARNRMFKGAIPAGWYPTKTLFHDKWMMIVSAKGIQARRPNLQGPQPVEGKGGAQHVLTLLQGSLSIIPKSEIASSLPAWTRTVEEGSPLYSPKEGFKLPIRHIFYIVRENRTYDQVMGDLGRGDGDPALTLFGKEITPNGHRLAEDFVTLDNYYANGEVSALGHSFTTSGYASPFLEWLVNTVYSRRYIGYPFGTVPAMASPAYIWDALDEKGIDYRIYGENYFLYTRAYKILCETFGPDSPQARKFFDLTMAFAAKVDRGNDFYEFTKPFFGRARSTEEALRLLSNPQFTTLLSKFLCGDESLAEALSQHPELRQRFAEYIHRYPFNYRSWDLTYSDLDRAEAWKADFEKQVETGNVAQFHYIWLPNDHTGGTDKKYLPPDRLAAQNDAALGLIVETISKSPVWKESLILTTEDDAQNGPDHVDATRTVALAAGPWVKRGVVVSDRYDQLSMLRTMEILLGLPPLNLNDALAAPMFGIFTDKPDLAPFKATAALNHLSDPDLERWKKLQEAPEGK